VIASSTKLYVPLLSGGKLVLAIVDTQNAAVERMEFDTTLYGQAGALTSDGKRLYLISGDLLSIALRSKRILAGKRLGGPWYWSMAISNDGRYLYLFPIGDQSLVAIDSVTYRVLFEVSTRS